MADYDKYIVSLEWRSVRNDALRRAGDECQMCRKTATEVHHNTYKNLGNEPPEDLIALCGDCHDKFHQRGDYAPAETAEDVEAANRQIVDGLRIRLRSTQKAFEAAQERARRADEMLLDWRKKLAVARLEGAAAALEEYKKQQRSEDPS